jgi:hypothetical protein
MRDRAYLRDVQYRDDPLRREVAAITDREGAFRIGTDSGMFVARTPIQSGS